MAKAGSEGEGRRETGLSFALGRLAVCIWVPVRPRFTLIELLAVMTILILIVLVAGSMTLYVLSGSSTLQRRAESDTEARGFMARIAYDLQTLAFMNLPAAAITSTTSNLNIPIIAIPATSAPVVNPSLGFICGSRSVSNTSTGVPRFSVVYYQVNVPPASTGDTQTSLLRGSAPVFWDTSASGDATGGGANDSSPSNALISASKALGTGQDTSGFSVTPDVVPIGAGIFRITYVFTLTNGNIVPLSSVPTLTSYSGLLSGNAIALDPSQISAITIGIAVLDSATERIVTSAQLQTLMNALTEPLAGQRPLDVWNMQNTTIQTALSGLPSAVARNIRFYQQTIVLP